jgi:hypothetical protein
MNVGFASQHTSLVEKEGMLTSQLDYHAVVSLGVNASLVGSR